MKITFKTVTIIFVLSLFLSGSLTAFAGLVTPQSPPVNAAAIVGTIGVTHGGTGSAVVPTSGQIPVGNAGGTAYAPQTLSGSGATASLSSAGVLSLSNIAPTAGGTGQSTTATSGRYLKGDGTNWGTSTGSASGTGACGANNWASTLNSDAPPTCTQPAFSNLSGAATSAQMPAALNVVNNQGTIGSGGTLSCDLSLGNICAATVGGGAFTIAKPTNGAQNVIYYLLTTSTADVSGTYASGWLQEQTASSLILPPTLGSGINTTVQYTPFVYDGTNYQILVTANLWARKFYAANMTGALTGGVTGTGNAITTTTGAHTSTTGAMGPTGGGILSQTGGTAPTITCSGGATGSSVTAGSTNNKGQVVTSSSASTNCTITWSATATWPQAPFCVFGDGAASITPTGVSTGTCGTATCVFDFASATSKTFNYICL